MRSIQNKKYLVLAAITVLTASLLLLGINQESFAHRDGCHRWHSCPSDSGSYECGDTGRCSECPDNNYCKAGNPRSSSGSSSSGSSSSGSSSSGSSSPSYPSSTTKPKVSSKLPECKGTKLCILGTVNKIIDGDTLTVDTYTIRLSLTNTPEKNEAGFKEAKAFTSKRCPVGSKAIVDQDDKQPTDKYKRTVAKVICSGNILNSDLLYYGHAKISTQYCKKSEFSSEEWAKKYGCTQTVQKKENKQTSSPPPPSVPLTQTKENSCDPSYPGVCIPPPPPDLDCSEIQYRNFKVLPPDPHRFDGDKDGIGCEK